MGTTQDCSTVRKELKAIHRRAIVLAKHTKDHMLPRLRSRNGGKAETEKLEKMWNDYSCCMELILAQLCKTLQLATRFPLQSMNFSQEVIRTGLAEKIVSQRRWAIVVAGLSAVVEPLTGLDSSMAEVQGDGVDNDETRLIKKAIFETSDLLKSIHDGVDIKPWTIKSTVDPELLFDGASISGASEAPINRSPIQSDRSALLLGGLCPCAQTTEADDTNDTMTSSAMSPDDVVQGRQQLRRRRRRRCLSISVAVFVFSVGALAAIIGVCVKRFS